MADIGLSEFSFGYAFLHEQTLRKWGRVIGVPILPSLRGEAKLGWDVKLPTKGKAFYYQFKLSERFSRSNSKFIADGTYSSSYYKIALHKANNNQQHRRLWELAQVAGNEETYYVAPEVHSSEIFEDAFLNRKVIENSRLIPLRECENYDPDDKEQHYITFKYGEKDFIQHSSQKKRSGSILGKNLIHIYDQKLPNFDPINDDFTRRLVKTVEDSVSEIIDLKKMSIVKKLIEERQPDNVSSELNYIANLLLSAFDLSLVIVGESQSENNHRRNYI
ncbi:MAG: hypothetical protein M1498_00505 [Candidatus Thermoplasmatota archaeon]|nr:hypothetical protein [Candidatus Thermoplasmatota archaeon]MCL5889025.1 hypothetical protein [Candidatus Thermoplasmatota archaeon]